MTDIITITEDEFDDTYPLLPNHLNPNASWTFGDGPGCLFETYGEELAFVRGQDPQLSGRLSTATMTPNI